MENIELEKNLFAENEKEKNKAKVELDTDDDGICDDWEINGYTVENGQIVKWQDDKHKDKGFIKYKSDPYNSRTTGDPFTDYEKVLGKCDPAILKEARHPLVAAYPKIGVNMEKMIFTKNQTVTKETGGSKGVQSSKAISVSTTNSHMETNHVGAQVSVSYPLGVSVSANYSYEWSNSVSHDKGSSDTEGVSSNQTWSEALNINQSEAALLNGNVKYLNVGTAPIYNVRPTLNFVLGQGPKSKTLNTIIAKNNTAAQVIFPGGVYPRHGQNAISWNTIDDFNSQPIKISFEQLKEIENGQKIQIQTIQTSGLFKIYRSDGSTLINEYQRWEHEMGDIYGKTACITIIFYNGLIAERRVYAPRENDPYALKHLDLTLKEAIELAFENTKVEKTKDKNKIFHKNIKYGYVDVILDKNTFKQINKQMEITKDHEIFNVKLKQGMNIMFKENEAMYIKNECWTIIEETKKIVNKKEIKDMFLLETQDFEKIIRIIKDALLQTEVDKNILNLMVFKIEKLDDWFFLNISYDNETLETIDMS